MIRKLSALGAAFALACALPAQASATTVSGTLANGALSSSIAVTAASSFSVSLPGPASISLAGVSSPTAGFTIMRSQDGVNFAPLARDSTGALAHYFGPVTIDLIEARAGTYYAIQADPGVASFAYRMDQ